MNKSYDIGKSVHWSLYVLLLIVFYFAIFYRLDTLILREWDESRNAVNAVEMIKNGNFLIRYYEGEPDMWELKPPLLVWLQVLSIQIFGFNELGVRIPSAIATLLLAIVLLNFSKPRMVGVIAALVLVTSTGYIGEHITRTGDHDSLLVLFMLLGLLTFDTFLESFPSSTNWKVYGVFLCFLLLGYMTKSIVSLMFLPGMFLHTLLQNKLKALLHAKIFYWGILCFAVVLGSYYLLREHYSPGYLNIVWRDELFPRYFNANEAFHKKPFGFYTLQLFETRFFPWAYLLIPALLFQNKLVPKENRRITRYFTITLLSFLVILSLGTYNFWYDAPAFPLMAFLVGQFIYYFVLWITKGIKSSWIRNSLVFCIVVGVFIAPLNEIRKKNLSNYENEYALKAYSISYMLRSFQKHQIEIPDSLQVLYEGHAAHLIFYMESIKKSHPQQSIVFTQKEHLHIGDKVVVSQHHIFDYLKETYEFKELYSFLDAKVLELTAVKIEVSVP